MRAVLGRFDGIWLIPLVGSLLVSFIGYHFAYRGIFRVDGGPTLPRRQMRAVVAAGFGGFLAHGGGSLDQYALRAAGTGEDEAKARVAALGGLEHGVLSIGGPRRRDRRAPVRARSTSTDFTVPWAVLPIPGFLIGFGPRGGTATGSGPGAGHEVNLPGLDPPHPGLVRPATAMVVSAVWHGAVLGGGRVRHLVVLAMVYFLVITAALFLGFATGMVFTRRTGPLAGAGVLALVLPLTIWASGASLAVAVAGVFVYRVLALLLPMPVSLAALPTLRKMAESPASQVKGTGEVNEPALMPVAGNRGIKDSG